MSMETLGKEMNAMLENRKVEKQLKEEAKKNEFVNQIAPLKVEEPETVKEEILDVAVRGIVNCDLLASVT